MTHHNLVLRRQAGKPAVSPENQLRIEKAVAFDLGTLKISFDAGEIHEDFMESGDETHFVFNMDNGQSIAFRGAEEVRYADVVAVDEGMTTMVRITGGRYARIEPPMLVFQNQNSSYPIRNVTDKVAGFCYRSGPKRWMDQKVFKE